MCCGIRSCHIYVFTLPAEGSIRTAADGLCREETTHESSAGDPLAVDITGGGLSLHSLAGACSRAALTRRRAALGSWSVMIPNVAH